MLKSIKKLSVMSALSLLMVFPVSAQDLFVKKGMFSQFEATTENLGKITAKQTIGGYPILRISDEMRLMLSSRPCKIHFKPAPSADLSFAVG